ncbi:MAG: MSMEG_0565 family glycosyltransferase [Candidatus Nanopelagicales bacterium]
MTQRVALLTYSTKPRGGVVHTLALAESLADRGHDVHVFGLGPADGTFYRSLRVPFTLYPAVESAESLDDKVFRSVDSFAEGLASTAGEFALIHAQDCISARAATRVRDAAGGPPVVRTVHHIDDFTTQALIDCQRQAVIEPDHILVVSRLWQHIMRDDFGRESRVVPNGVDTERLRPISPDVRATLRASVGATDRPLYLTVGGIEPRKGTRDLFEALPYVRERGVDPVLAVLGGHSFQDYRAYRDAALARLPELGLDLGRDVIEVGTVSEDVLGQWFRSADVLAMPSTKEGFGLVALEGLAAQVPVVASSIPVFAEFLTNERSALLPEVGNPRAIADALYRATTDHELRETLISGGEQVLPHYTWAESARQHEVIYDDVLRQTA